MNRIALRAVYNGCPNAQCPMPNAHCPLPIAHCARRFVVASLGGNRQSGTLNPSHPVGKQQQQEERNG